MSKKLERTKMIDDMWEFDFFKMPTNELMRLAEKQYKLELNNYTQVAFKKKYSLMFGLQKFGEAMRGD